MALQSHTALAEIRDTLLETYASNGAMNQLILCASRKTKSEFIRREHFAGNRGRLELVWKGGGVAAA